MSPACFTCSQTDVLSTITNAYWDILHLLLSAQVNLGHVCFANQKLLVCEKCADLLRDIGKFREDAVKFVNTQIQYWDDMQAIKKEPVEFEGQTVYDAIYIGHNQLPSEKWQEPSENLVITPDIVKLERDGEVGLCLLSGNLNGEVKSEMSSLMVGQATVDTSDLNNWMVNTYGQMSCDVNFEDAGYTEEEEEEEEEEEDSYTGLTLVANVPGHSGVPTPEKIFTAKDKKRKKKKKNGNKSVDPRHRRGLPYRTRPLSAREVRRRREEQRRSPPFSGARHRCATCIEAFGSAREERAHRLQYHRQKPSRMECWVCKRTLPARSLIQHVSSHHRLFECLGCKFTSQDLEAMQAHPCKRKKKREKDAEFVEE